MLSTIKFPISAVIVKDEKVVEPNLLEMFPMGVV
jgi:hypothetical protein